MTGIEILFNEKNAINHSDQWLASLYVEYLVNYFLKRTGYLLLYGDSLCLVDDFDYEFAVIRLVALLKNTGSGSIMVNRQKHSWNVLSFDAHGK